jgi:hypothetical protein
LEPKNEWHIEALQGGDDFMKTATTEEQRRSYFKEQGSKLEVKKSMD